MTDDTEPRDVRELTLDEVDAASARQREHAGRHKRRQGSSSGLSG